jgi:anti-sigma factor ChrR (cupin superfamily)
VCRAGDQKTSEVLADVHEAMLDACRDERDRARLDGHRLLADDQPAPAGDDVIDLVLGVRRLVVGRSGRPAGDRQAQRVARGSEHLREVVPVVGHARQRIG